MTEQTEIWSTRVYLFLLLIFTTILLFYSGIVAQTQHETIANPTLSNFVYLQLAYSDTLKCSCSQMSISYRNFTVHLNVTLHPICTSFFITDKWINYAAKSSIYPIWWMDQKDFRTWNILFFRLLQSLCSLANGTVTSAIEEFLSSLFISSEVLPAEQFLTYVHNSLGSFQKSISTLYARPLQTFRSNVASNTLVSIGNNGWELKAETNENYTAIISIPVTYNNASCSCATSVSCFEPAAFYDMDGKKFYTVQGVSFGCYYLDSILFSTLSCFFSNSCIIEYALATVSDDPTIVSLSDFFNISDTILLEFSSSSAHFTIDDTIETMVNQLFIDSWSNETSYDRYFDTCAPSFCTYSYTRRLDIGFMVATFLGIYNGIATVLRYSVPHIVRISHKIYKRIKRGHINVSNDR